jgi:hypothetical protein
MNKAELFFATTDAIYDKFSNRRYPNASNIHKDSDRKYGEDTLQNFDI